MKDAVGPIVTVEARCPDCGILTVAPPKRVFYQANRGHALLVNCVGCHTELLVPLSEMMGEETDGLHP